MKDRYIVSMDEFPLKMEKSSSLDYGGYIVYRVMGGSKKNNRRIKRRHQFTTF